MQFVPDGPDIPLAVLQSHEEGRLVFLCGAGVSRPAGLPDFKGLVSRVVEDLGAKLTRDERRECGRGQFDRLLGHLADAEHFGRQRVCDAVWKALTPLPDAILDTHKSILDLAQNRQGALRLITTNFDELFERARPGIPIASAPLLPVPKPMKWSSLVHLHGRMMEAGIEGRNLVLTAGDFGIAYLAERWASRFVSELFNHFDVLFIGYSADDPPMRYLVDALAAERQGDRRIHAAYALISAQPGREAATTAAWGARGIQAIPYTAGKDHAMLHETLRAWASVWRGGLGSKKNILNEYGSKDPSSLGPEAASQVCWALTEPDGSMARHFAQLDPRPPLAWLPILEKSELLSIPPTLSLKTGLPLVDHSQATSGPPHLSPISMALAIWLTAHLDQPELIDWVLQTGGSLHPDWIDAIRHKIRTTTDLPTAFQKVWRVLCSSRSAARRTGGLDTFHLIERMRTEMWSPSLRLDVVQALRPDIALSSAWSRTRQEAELLGEDPGAWSIRRLVSVDCTLRAGDSLTTLINALAARSDASVVLRDLAWEITELLRQALDLLAGLDHANSERDPSYLWHPSIAPHEQNRYGAQWTWLIEIVRRTFEALAKYDPDQAKLLVGRWMGIPYPTFRRLVLYGAATAGTPTPVQTLAFLLDPPHPSLWTTPSERELFQLLPTLWPALDDSGRARLIAALLSGPPRAMYREDLTAAEWEEARDRAVWERVARLRNTSPPLLPDAAQRLLDLEKQHPDWRLAGAEDEDFPVWGESRVGLDSDYSSETLLALTDDQLAGVLLNHQRNRRGLMMQWREAVGADPARGVRILRTLVARPDTPPDLWSSGLAGIARLTAEAPSVDAVLSLLADLPQERVGADPAPIADFVRSVAGKVSDHLRDRVLTIYDRALLAAVRVPVSSDPDRVYAAINHPAGVLAEGLFAVLRSRPLTRNAGLPADVRERLEALLAMSGDQARLARVIIASRLVLLHELDAGWTCARVIPFFDWQIPEEAVGTWQGYLWSPSITLGLWADLKPHFIDAFNHLIEVGEPARNLAGLLAAISIEGGPLITAEEARGCLRWLDDSGRAEVARWLGDRLEGAGAQAETLWQERIGPWIKAAWPQELPLRGPHATHNLARAATLAQGAFSEAVDCVAPFLVPMENDATIVLETLVGTGHLESWPDAALVLLNAITPENPASWFGPLGTCLARIETAAPSITADPRFRRLRDIADRNGL